jgi:hypothetical protein
VGHWFDDLSKRAARVGEGRRTGRPAGRTRLAGSGDQGAARGDLFSRRSVLFGASAFGLGALASTSPLRVGALNYARAQTPGACPEETRCKKAAYEDNKAYVKEACASPYPGFVDSYRDGEAGFKLGCVTQAAIRLGSRLDSCAKRACPCPQGHDRCGGDDCLDLQTDDNNCGKCGHVCVASSSCTNGHCVCNTCGNAGNNPYSQICDGQCVDTSGDPSNCGGCGNVCPQVVNGFRGICNCGQCDGCEGGVTGFWCCQTGTCTHACPSPGETCP